MFWYVQFVPSMLPTQAALRALVRAQAQCDTLLQIIVAVSSEVKAKRFIAIFYNSLHHSQWIIISYCLILVVQLKFVSSCSSTTAQT